MSTRNRGQRVLVRVEIGQIFWAVGGTSPPLDVITDDAGVVRAVEIPFKNVSVHQVDPFHQPMLAFVTFLAMVGAMNRTHLRPGPRSYWLSAEALAAQNRLSLALDLPKTKVLDLALLRLLELFDAGRLAGVRLDIRERRGGGKNHGTRPIHAVKYSEKREKRKRNPGNRKRFLPRELAKSRRRR